MQAQNNSGLVLTNPIFNPLCHAPLPPCLVQMAGNPLNADARRRLFMGDRARRGRAFTPEHVWTFYIWQQVRRRRHWTKSCK